MFSEMRLVIHSKFDGKLDSKFSGKLGRKFENLSSR